MEKNKNELGIYIHIPFCKHKCFYCDFLSYCNKDDLIENYVKCVVKELEYNLIKIKDNYEITTIYIGGGTPSYINSKYIGKILKKIPIQKDIEVTIELNPGTVSKEKLKEYKESGISRLSIGLQSTNDMLLKQIGRIHNFDQFLDTYTLARRVGFNNINVDLMLGLPNQTIEDLSLSLQEIIKLNPEHISVYSLILEENTKLYNLVNKKKIFLPEEEIERQMYWYVKDTLELKGYKHYEISNFAKTGYESKHNLNCWKQKEYLGFGLGASSYIDSVRYSNIRNINRYIENIEKGEFEKNKIVEEVQTKEEKQKEFMLLGLRLIKGVSIQEFKTKFEQNPIYVFKEELNKLSKANLIQVDEDKIKLTSKGLDLANQVWIDLT